MRDNTQLVTRANDDMLEMAHGQAQLPSAPKQQNPFLLAHSLLRGRYSLAITLGLLGLIIGGVVGYLLKKPDYQGLGQVNVSPTMPRLLYQTEQNSLMPMFESFIAKQVALIRHRRVIDETLAYPQWKSMGRAYTPELVAEFEQNLRVEAIRGAGIIQVSYVDEDPRAAALAVRGVLESYKRIFADDQAEGGGKVIDRLNGLRQKYLGDLNEKNGKILAASGGLGSAFLQQSFEYNMQELNKCRSELFQLERQITALGGRRAGPTTAPATAPVGPPPPSLEALTLRDSYFQNLRGERLKLEMQLNLDSVRLGQNHPSIFELRTKLDLIDKRIAERAKELQDAALLAAAVLPGDPAGGVRSVDELQRDFELLRRQEDSLQLAMKELGNKQQEIAQLRVEATTLEEQLATTKARIEQLSVEQNMEGRINVMSYGETPIKPFNDPRRKLTLFGAFGMCSVGVGFVMLLGFLDRRMRHIDAARMHLHQVERMLGVIPELPAGMNDTEQSTSAAYCIHQVRAMLQIRQRATGHKVFAITSPSPGDGKTSLTIALGMSLAASGQRTMVVDCDIEGAALSAKLRRRGHARGDDRLVLGDLQTALRGEPLDQCIHPTGLSNLDLLPLSTTSSTTPASIGRISPESLRATLDALAQRYDVVLVDCGPVLGSIEAPIVSAEADGVVLVISRGGNRTTAEAAVKLLHSAGAEIEGIVFNRAEATDVARSAYRSSSSSRSSRSQSASLAARSPDDER